MILLMLATLAGPVQELPPPGLLLRSPRAQVRAACRGEESPTSSDRAGSTC